MYVYCTVCQYVELAARMIAETMETSSGRKIVVEKSTVPVRAAESIANILRYLHTVRVLDTSCFEAAPGIYFLQPASAPEKLLIYIFISVYNTGMFKITNTGTYYPGN